MNEQLFNSPLLQTKILADRQTAFMTKTPTHCLASYGTVTKLPFSAIFKLDFSMVAFPRAFLRTFVTERERESHYRHSSEAPAWAPAPGRFTLQWGMTGAGVG